MSNSNSACDEPDGFSPSTVKKKRNLPGHPDPDAEVIALSPRSLLATNRFVCEICNKGFQRDQNLQLHRRGHNLPWRLKQKAGHEVKKKVYICPELTCVHHDPARALGDLTGIKKHFSRKHGEKKWKCDKCTKRYAVQSDWKAHQKTCGTREYRCDCGTLFSRRDSFITHRAFCDALAEENGRMSTHSRQGESHDQTTQLPNDSYMPSAVRDMRALSSPTSQITRDGFAYAEVSKPASFNDRMASDLAFSFASDFCSQEGSIASSWGPRALNDGVSTWLHTGMKSDIATSNKSPGLSLCLGMGPGPGPPCSFQEMMANMESSGPALEFPSLDALHKLYSYDTRPHASMPSMGAMDMLSTLFSSPKHGCTRRDSTNGMLGALGYGSSMNELMSAGMQPHSTTTMKQTSEASTSRLPTSVSSMMVGIGHQNRVIEPYQHAATSSATALLQKAAQMGATASKPSLLQKFGMGMGTGEALGSTGQEIQRQAMSWAGASSMYSSSKPKQAGDQLTSKMASGWFEGTKEYIHTTDAGGAAGHHRRLKKTWTDPNQTSLPFLGSGAPESSSSTLSAPRPPPSPLSNMRGSQRRDHEGDTAPMVDFLGVGGSSAAMVGFLSKCRNQDGSKSFSSE